MPDSKKPDQISLKRLLKKDSNLANLTQRAEQLIQLERHLLSVLPEELASHCRLGSVEGNTLTLIVDSAVWATRIRFDQARLLSRLQQSEGWSSVTKLRTKIRPQEGGRKSQISAKPISAEAAAQIEDTAKSLAGEGSNEKKNSDEEDKLSQALARLAKHQKDV